jgi:hypothetical protein
MQGMVTIMNGSDVYYLFEKTRKYFQEDVKELTAKNPSAAIRDFDQFIRSNNLRKTGTDSIEGYKCDIYQGDVDFGQAAGGQFESAPMKIWYARNLDYALKTEATLPSPMGRVVTRLKNIKTGSQPGSLFTVPAEYDRAGTMQEAMGLGEGFNLPESLEGMEGMEGMSGDMPSPEEMEEIMKKMQEMLKQQN